MLYSSPGLAKKHPEVPIAIGTGQVVFWGPILFSVWRFFPDVLHELLVFVPTLPDQYHYKLSVKEADCTALSLQNTPTLGANYRPLDTYFYSNGYMRCCSACNDLSVFNNPLIDKSSSNNFQCIP